MTDRSSSDAARPKGSNTGSISDAARAFFDSLADHVAVMGILNVTPDSFSGDGLINAVDSAVAQSRSMQAAGCHILDIGGESTRPGSAPVSDEDELARVAPVLKAVRKAIDLPISIDTYKASVARETLGSGACIVNDVWGLQKDPDMGKTVAETGAGLVIMHNRTKADADIDIIADIHRFFEKSLEIAAIAKIDPDVIALDPGIGFGKTIQQNLVILNRLETFRKYGRPLLIGLSRKRFIGEALGKPVEDRLTGTLAANIIACTKGASIIRVHDVTEHAEAVRMMSVIKRESYG